MKVSRQTLSAGLSGVALLAGSFAVLPASAQQYEPSAAKPSSETLSIATQKSTENQAQPGGVARVRLVDDTASERATVQRIAQTMVVPGGTVVPDGSTTAEDATVVAADQTTTTTTVQPRRYRVGPSTAFYTPTGFGLTRGQAALWALYQAETRHSSEDDGSVGAIVGLGRPEKLGFDVGVNFLSLFGGRGDDAGFGERGSFNFKLHRRIRPDLSVAVGVRNTLIWDGSDAPTRYYGVVSKVFRTKEDYREKFSRVYASIGIERSSVGSQNDPFEDEAQSVIDEFGRTNLFGSLAVKLSEPVNAFVEWSGEDLNAGVSFVPFRNVPLVVTPAIVDITGKASDDPRFNLAVAYLFNF